MAIPRPVIARRQNSSPAGCGGLTPINLSESRMKLSSELSRGKWSSGSRSSTMSSSTNPFLNGSLSIPEDDDMPPIPVGIGISTALNIRPYTMAYESPKAAAISTQHTEMNSARRFFPERFECKQQKPLQLQQMQRQEQLASRNPFAKSTSNRIFAPLSNANGIDINKLIDRDVTNGNVAVRANSAFCGAANVHRKNSNGSDAAIDTTPVTNHVQIEVAETKVYGPSTTVLYTDEFYNLGNAFDKQYRNRSLSDTEASDVVSKNFVELHTSSSSSTNPFVDGEASCSNSSWAGNNVGASTSDRNTGDSACLHKTLSDTYLEQLNRNRRRSVTSICGSTSQQPYQQPIGSFGSVRNGSISAGMTKSNGTLNNDNDTVDIKRTMSCDSVTSESSVCLADLEQVTPPVTGMLCIGLQFDR